MATARSVEATATACSRMSQEARRMEAAFETLGSLATGRATGIVRLDCEAA